RGSSFSNSVFPASGALWANLAVFWDDLFMNPSQTGFYWAFETDAKGKEGLIIQWGELTNGSKFQMVLWEDGSFDYRYGNFSSSTTSATVGYQNTTATAWAAIGQNVTIPGGLANRSWRFGYEPRPPSGSYSFRPQNSMQLLLEATGATETTAIAEVVVQ